MLLTIVWIKYICVLMEIYKLGEVCSMKKGKGKFYKRHLTQNSQLNVAFHYGLLYKNNIINDWNIHVSKIFFRKDNIAKINDILLVDVSESFNEIGHVVINEYKNGLIGNHIIHLYNFKGVNPKWLYYYLKNNQLKFKQFAYGDKVASLKISDIKHLQINELPSIEEQQSIIDIIEPIEHLLLKLENSNKHLFKLSKHIYDESEKIEKKVSDLNFKYGKSIPQSKRIKGVYKMYGANGVIDFVNESLTTSPALILGCRGNSVGALHWDYDKIMVLNTSLYLECEGSMLPNIYFALNDVDGFKHRATGAAQPQITINNISDLSISLAKDYKELHVLFSSIHRNNKLINHLEKAKKAMLCLLIK